MTPDWLNDIVQAFGRQMGLQEFRLRDNGAAGATFENGLSLRFEYANEMLMMSMGVQTAPSDAVMKNLLLAAHPAAQQTAVCIRAGYLKRTGEALLTMRLQEREVTVTTLETAFRQLWSAAERLRRTVS